MKFPNLNPFLGKDGQSVGIVRYLETFFMNVGQLLVCNLLFVVCSLPVFTVGPGLVALARVSCNALRGRAISPVKDFFDAFKKNFFPGILVSIVIVPVYLWQYSMCSLALQTHWETGANLPQFSLFAIGFVAMNCFAMYLLPMIAFLKAGGWTVVRNSFLLCFAGGGFTLLGGLTTAVLFAVGMLSLPHSLPLVLALFFSLLVYNGCFFSWKVMDKFVFAPYYEAHPEEILDDNY